MSNTKIYIQGELSSIKTTEYKGEKVSKLQFLNENENGGLEIIEIKIDKDHLINDLKKGDKVMVPVSMSAIEKKIYYRTNGKIQVSK